MSLGYSTLIFQSLQTIYKSNQLCLSNNASDSAGEIGRVCRDTYPRLTGTLTECCRSAWTYAREGRRRDQHQRRIIYLAASDGVPAELGAHKLTDGLDSLYLVSAEGLEPSTP